MRVRRGIRAGERLAATTDAEQKADSLLQPTQSDDTATITPEGTEALVDAYAVLRQVAERVRRGGCGDG
jgi:hypothetical protein